MIYQGIWTSIAMKPYIFVFFHGGGVEGEGGGLSVGSDTLSPLWIHAWILFSEDKPFELVW